MASSSNRIRFACPNRVRVSTTGFTSRHRSGSMVRKILGPVPMHKLRPVQLRERRLQLRPDPMQRNGRVAASNAGWVHIRRRPRQRFLDSICPCRSARPEGTARRQAARLISTGTAARMNWWWEGGAARWLGAKARALHSTSRNIVAPARTAVRRRASPQTTLEYSNRGALRLIAMLTTTEPAPSLVPLGTITSLHFAPKS